MLGYSLGENPANLVIDIAINDKKDFTPKYRKSSTLLGICVPETMVFNGIDNEDEILDNGALVIGAFKSKGKEYFYPPKSNIDVIARVITTGDTIEASYERAKQAVSVAKFS